MAALLRLLLLAGLMYRPVHAGVVFTAGFAGENSSHCAKLRSWWEHDADKYPLQDVAIVDLTISTRPASDIKAFCDSELDIPIKGKLVRVNTNNWNLDGTTCHKDNVETSMKRFLKRVVAAGAVGGE